MRGHFAVGVQSREQGEECRKQCVATMQWASVEHGRIAVRVEYREKIRTGTHGRIAVRGAPKRAGQALLSTLFSLLSTDREEWDG